jgi:predicted nucleic acid-binding protein
MTSRAFVDTNVFVYAIDDAEPAMQQAAQELLASVDPVISTQVVGEFFVVASRALGGGRRNEEARARAVSLLDLEVLAIDGDLVARALDGSVAWGMSYWDALIVCTAQAAGCARLLTEDLGDGRTYGSVTVENPFR